MKTEEKHIAEHVLPSFWVSIIPLLFLVSMTVCVVRAFGSDALSGASQIVLLTAAAISVGLGLFFKHITWDDFEKAVTTKISEVTQAIIILLLIGALGSAWMISGIVPTIICYGLKVVNPDFFLPLCCIICAVVSLLTGSSWTTVATIGIALLGIGKALGFSDGWIAGAIISGSYFGDKISPLSDTTVLASSSAGTPIFVHIRYLLYTTIPTFAVTLAIYAVYGVYFDQSNLETSSVISAKLGETFCISPWLLCVPVLTGVMISKRMPSIMVLFAATLMAAVAALAAQPNLLEQIAGNADGSFSSKMKGLLVLLYGSTRLETGVEALDNLVATRGMAGMMPTIWLILCAATFGGAMTATNMLESIMTTFTKRAKSMFSAVASTTVSGVLLNTVCGDQYLSIILEGNMFKDIYKKRGLEPRLLSRTIEDSATVTSALVPWNTCGMTQSTVLGVAVFAYLPYAFFNYLSPISTIITAAIGYKIYTATKPAPKPDCK